MKHKHTQILDKIYAKEIAKQARLLEQHKRNAEIRQEVFLAELQLELLPPEQYFLVKSEYVDPDIKIELENYARTLAEQETLKD